MYVPPGLDIPTGVLLRNTHRLVTHHDVHATLLGLARLPGRSRSPPDSRPGSGFDLLRQDVPPKRSCAESGLPAPWCNCFAVAEEGEVRVDPGQSGARPG